MSKFGIELLWAAVFVATLLVWMVLERAVGLHSSHIDKHMVYTNFFAIPAIAVYVLALRDKKARTYGGQMNYRQGLTCGVLITLIVALCSPLTQWIISTIITPDYFANVIDYSVKSGYYATVEAAQAHFNLQSYMIQSAVGALVMGVVTSMVVAFFLRSRPM